MGKRVVKSKQYTLSPIWTQQVKIPTISYIETYEIPNLIDKEAKEWLHVLEEIEQRRDSLDNMTKAAAYFKDNEDFFEGYIRGVCLCYSLVGSVVKPIPIISIDTLNSALVSVLHDKVGKNKEVYEKLFDEQPTFREMVAYVVEHEYYEKEFKDGFCKGLVQVYELIWRTLEAKELEELFA